MEHCPTPRPDCTGLGVGLGSWRTHPCPPRGSLASQPGIELQIAEEVRGPGSLRPGVELGSWVTVSGLDSYRGI